MIPVRISINDGFISHFFIHVLPGHDPGVERTNHEATAPPLYCIKSAAYYLTNFDHTNMW